ncbi:DUF2513 domain-containing protein [Pseudomonas zeae]
MNETEMNTSENPLAHRPLHHLLFVKLRNGARGPVHLALSVADRHGISVEQLKAHCRLTGEEWLARDGVLTESSQRVYEWANS